MSYGEQNYGGNRYGYAAALDFTRTFSEDLIVEDSYSLQVRLLLSNPIIVGEDYTKTGTLFRTYSGTVNTQETYSRTGTFLRSYSGALNTQETYSSTGTFLRSYSEDVITHLTYDRTVDYQRSFIENLVSSDSYDRATTLFRQYVENTVVDETVDLTRVYFRNIIENVAFEDVRDPITVSLVREENAAFSDQYDRTASLFRGFEDVLEVFDRSNLRPELFLKEKIRLSDSYSDALALFRQYNETFSVDDALISRTTGKFLQEGILFEEFSQFVSQHFRSYIEDISVADTYGREYTGFRSYNEIGGLQATYSRTADYYRDINESVLVYDLYSRRYTGFRSFNALAVFEKSYLSAADLSRDYFEDAELADKTIFELRKKLVESVEVADDFAYIRNIFRSYSESIVFADLRPVFSIFRGVDSADLDVDVFERYGFVEEIFEAYEVDAEVY